MRRWGLAPAALYVMGSPGANSVTHLLTKSLSEAMRRKKLGDIAAEKDQRAINALVDADDALAGLQKNLRTEQQALESQRDELDRLIANMEQQQSTLDQAVAKANTLLATARAIGALRAGNYPVTGLSALTAAQMAGWFKAQHYSPRLSGVTIDQLTQIYVNEGNDEGIRGDLAFAQSVLETGGFSSAPANNYAGIGWCDSCSDGVHFPTPTDGVRAQIQLLLNYADQYSRAAKLAHPVSPYLYGSDPTSAARRFDTFFAKGWAPTWTDMGHGNWATDPNYSGKVIKIYTSMAAWAQGS